MPEFMSDVGMIVSWVFVFAFVFGLGESTGCALDCSHGAVFGECTVLGIDLGVSAYKACTPAL